MGSSIYAHTGFFNHGDRQPRSTELNEGQRDCVGPGPVREPVFIDWRVIRMCQDEMDAINLCIDLSRLKDEFIAAKLGIDKGHWSRIRKGMAHFPTAKRLDLMYLCGNWAPIQFELEKTRLMERLAAELRQQEHPAASMGWRAA